MDNYIITGANGQDGFYLKELLEIKGHNVIPIGRDSFKSFDKIPRKIQIKEIIDEFTPKAIFHLAAHHGSSKVNLNSDFDKELMIDVNLRITKEILDSVFNLGLTTKVIIAGSSHMFTTESTDFFVDENTKMNPRNFYGITKSISRKLCEQYREEYGVQSSMAILFNHESPRRKNGFLSVDIAEQVVSVMKNKQKTIKLINPHARNDMSDARDIVAGIFLASNCINSEDYVFGSGSAVSAFDIIKILESHFRISLPVEKLGATKNFSPHQKILNPTLIANISKANNKLGWAPSRPITDTIIEMVNLRMT